jgi:hypothetical protein
LLQAIARLPCRSHFAVHADQSGLPRSRGNLCLVLLLSDTISLNKIAVNQNKSIPFRIRPVKARPGGSTSSKRAFVDRYPASQPAYGNVAAVC